MQMLTNCIFFTIFTINVKILQVMHKTQSYPPDHWVWLSVSGTYMTPIKFFIVMVPSAALSTCVSTWSQDGGPTGIIILPPGANWFINCSKRKLHQLKGCILETISGSRDKSLFKIRTNCLWHFYSCCANVNCVVRGFVFVSEPTIAHWRNQVSLNMLVSTN